MKMKSICKFLESFHLMVYYFRFELSDKVLLAPELMNAIGSNPELLRKFQAVLSEVQDEINDMK